MNLGGLAGLSGAYGGYQEAEGQDLQNRLRAQALAQQAYDLAQQQGGDIGFGQYLRGGAQGLGGLGGIPPIGGGGMPPQPRQPIGGAPSPSAPPPTGGQPAPFPQQRFGFSPGPSAGPAMQPGLQQRGAMLQQNPQFAVAGAVPQYQQAQPPQQMPFTPQQQPMGQPGQGQPQQRQQETPIGMMDIRQVLMGLAESNPGAPPQVLAAAAKNLLPLINAGNHAAMAEASLMLKAMGLENSMLRTGALYGVGPYGDVFGDVTGNKAGRAAAVAQGTLPIREEGSWFLKNQRPLRAFNVLVPHLGELENTIDALYPKGDNTLAPDMNALRGLRNFWLKEMGSELPTDFAGVRNIVAREIVSAIEGGAGAVFDRAEVQNDLAASNSPRALKSLINRYRHLAGDQLRAMGQQYETFGHTTEDFENKYVMPETRKYFKKDVEIRDKSGKTLAGGGDYSADEIAAEMKRRGLQ